MSDAPPGPSREPGDIRYLVEVDGVVDPRWVEWFEGQDVNIVPSLSFPQRTVLIVQLPDQAALPALLARVTGLNLRVITVRPATGEARDASP